MTVAWFVATTGALLALGVAILVATGLTRRPFQPGLPAILGSLGGFLAGLGAGILSVSVMSQQGNASWEDAASPHAGTAPLMSLEPGENAVWRTVLRNSWLTAGGIAVLVAGVVIAAGTMRWPSTMVAIDRIDKATVIDVRPTEWAVGVIAGASSS